MLVSVRSYDKDGNELGIWSKIEKKRDVYSCSVCKKDNEICIDCKKASNTYKKKEDKKVKKMNKLTAKKTKKKTCSESSADSYDCSEDDNDNGIGPLSDKSS